MEQTCSKARAVRLALSGIPLFYDVTLRPGFEDRTTVDELLCADAVVKCNEAELDWLSRELALSGDPAEALLRRYPLTSICVTLGADGCRIHANGHTVYERVPTVPAIGTVGAGDAFSAALLHGFTAWRWMGRRLRRLLVHWWKGCRRIGFKLWFGQ